MPLRIMKTLEWCFVTLSFFFAKDQQSVQRLCRSTDSVGFTMVFCSVLAAFLTAGVGMLIAGVGDVYSGVSIRGYFEFVRVVGALKQRGHSVCCCIDMKRKS